MTTAGSKARKGEHPEHFYVEPRWAVEALADHLAPLLKGGFMRQSSAVWDPACGTGTIPATFGDRGFEAFGSDIIFRGGVDTSRWHRENFLKATSAPCDPFDYPQPMSIIMNPPYKDMEAFVRRALEIADRYVAVIAPYTWLGSIERFPFFTLKPPLTVASLSERATMPPGDKIAELGSKAFKGGRICYCWLIWDVRQKSPMTRHIWLPPRPEHLRKAA
jgi:hypothetical protein